MPTPPPPQPDTGTDFGPYHALFFEEAGENLQRLEQLLLALDPTAPDDAALHAIFRCAHSVKGGAATFGMSDVAELTHRMETLLDRLRRHELKPSTAMVDTLLQAADALKAQLVRHQTRDGPQPDVVALLGRLGDWAATAASSAPADAPTTSSGMPMPRPIANRADPPSTTSRPRFLYQLAILPMVVVFPAPLTPTTSTTVSSRFSSIWCGSLGSSSATISFFRAK